jgi:hypothetical protein
MTTGIKLGSNLSESMLIRILEDCGCVINVRDIAGVQFHYATHPDVADVSLQLVEPTKYFKDDQRVRTDIFFDDKTDRFPDHPEAIALLERFGNLVPDLRCRELYFRPRYSQVIPVMDYLTLIRKKSLQSIC